MLALGLLVHLLAAAPGATPSAERAAPSAAPPARPAPAREPLAAASLPASATDAGTGSGVDPLAARPALAIPAAPRPELAPRLRGPFGGAELALAGIGALAGDALVLGLGYGALQLFAHGAIQPTAPNFRRAAYVMGAAALVVPPLLAVLGARLATGRQGSFWRALLLATAGQALALGAGYLASPQLWTVLPAQLAVVTTGASLGLRWGAGRGAAPDAEPGSAAGAPPALAPALAFLDLCPLGR
jgi:hypothetical protein